MQTERLAEPEEMRDLQPHGALEDPGELLRIHPGPRGDRLDRTARQVDEGPDQPRQPARFLLIGIGHAKKYIRFPRLSRPPRYEVGAGERSPSAPRLKPSIVTEREGEAPRVEPLAPHSPDFVSSGELSGPSEEPSGSSEGPFARHFPSFEPHSLPFGPSEEDVEPREPGRGPHSLPFELHSRRFASSEGLLAWHSPLSGRLGELLASSGAWGIPSEGLYGSYSPNVAYYPSRGMPSQPRGMASELSFGSSEEEGTSRRIHKKRHEVPILP
jgi:hypothetical protein